jgi:hypothetical protein
MNPLDPNLLRPMERRAELCRILALGLVRLRMRTGPAHPAGIGEVCLHSPADRSGHATPTHRRPA